MSTTVRSTKSRSNRSKSTNQSRRSRASRSAEAGRRQAIKISNATPDVAKTLIGSLFATSDSVSPESGAARLSVTTGDRQAFLRLLAATELDPMVRLTGNVSESTLESLWPLILAHPGYFHGLEIMTETCLEVGISRQEEASTDDAFEGDGQFLRDEADTYANDRLVRRLPWTERTTPENSIDVRTFSGHMLGIGSVRDALGEITSQDALLEVTIGWRIPLHELTDGTLGLDEVLTDPTRSCRLPEGRYHAEVEVPTAFLRRLASEPSLLVDGLGEGPDLLQGSPIALIAPDLRLRRSADGELLHGRLQISACQGRWTIEWSPIETQSRTALRACARALGVVAGMTPEVMDRSEARERARVERLLGALRW